MYLRESGSLLSSSGSELVVVVVELINRDPSSRIVMEMLNVLVISGSGDGDRGGGGGGDGTRQRMSKSVGSETTVLTFLRRPSNLRNIVMRIRRSALDAV